tara:strand:+ start:7236 stop:7604 length:369 start_codon:yes stop_codon:yes gene_type:complete
MSVDSQLARFFGVGIINTVFGYSVYSLIIFLGYSFFLAALLSQIIGTLFNYKTISTFVFPSNSVNRLHRFIIVYIASYVINVITLSILINLGYNAYVSGAIIIIPMALLTFYLNKHFVFNNE